MAAPNSPKGFLSLPAELRNNIYELALVKDDPIEVVPRPSQRFWGFTTLDSSLSDPPLTRVSKQIREESLAIHYGQNTFTALDLTSMAQLLFQLDDRRIKMLRRLIVEGFYHLHRFHDFHWVISQWLPYVGRTLVPASIFTVQVQLRDQPVTKGLVSRDVVTGKFNPLRALPRSQMTTVRMTLEEVGQCAMDDDGVFVRQTSPPTLCRVAVRNVGSKLVTEMLTPGEIVWLEIGWDGEFKRDLFTQIRQRRGW